ncbi:MAG: hypothetical protein ACRDHX_09270 [Chloroflexota bacterium]
MDLWNDSAARFGSERSVSARLSERSIEEWQGWIESLSPRQVIRRMYQWQWIAEDKPALRADLLAVIDLVRRLLLDREHRLG